MKLDWKDTKHGPEAILGNFSDHDGVRFSIMYMPTCHRRGPWRLLIEVADRLHGWGCFDMQDQPMRFYHSLDRLKGEAQDIANVLLIDRAELIKELGKK